MTTRDNAPPPDDWRPDPHCRHVWNPRSAGAHHWRECWLCDITQDIDAADEHLYRGEN